MTVPGDALEAGILVAQTLEQHGVPYALGGALAYGRTASHAPPTTSTSTCSLT